jgi:multiple sugar transport system ATP-binding protein
MLGLTEYLDRKPRALSGGQRQRVALGRAIVRKPRVFLFDEPLSNLDAELRVTMRAEIAKLQRRLKITTVYVTHDQVEAMTMGDRVAVLKDGVLQQLGTPRNLYAQPDNVFVAGFIGSPSMNLLEVPSTEGAVHFGDLVFPVEAAGTARPGGRVTLGVRPEDLKVSDRGLAVEVDVVEELGADAYVYGKVLGSSSPDVPIAPAPGQALDEEGNLELVVRTDGDRPPRKGEVIRLAPRPGRVHLFDTASGLRLVQREPAGAPGP